MTLAVNLPFHVYGYVDTHFLSAGEVGGIEPAVWFGLTVPANRAIGLTVLLENGGMYRELPPHAWAFAPEADNWTLEQAQRWNCFGGAAQAIAYDYLREFECYVHRARLPGTYLFTLEFGDNGYSRYPGQSKALHALQLENGRLTLQPGNEVVWHDGSFTTASAVPTWLRRQEDVWSVAEGEPWWTRSTGQ